MTPSLIRTEHISVNMNTPDPVKQERTGISIALGHALTLLCNRKEDFVVLKTLAEKAIELCGERDWVGD